MYNYSGFILIFLQRYRREIQKKNIKKFEKKISRGGLMGTMLITCDKNNWQTEIQHKRNKKRTYGITYGRKPYNLRNILHNMTVWRQWLPGDVHP